MYGEITQKSEINLVWTRIQKPPQKKKAPLQVGLHNKYKQVSFISTGILVIRSKLWVRGLVLQQPYAFTDKRLL